MVSKQKGVITNKEELTSEEEQKIEDILNIILLEDAFGEKKVKKPYKQKDCLTKIKTKKQKGVITEQQKEIKFQTFIKRVLDDIKTKSHADDIIDDKGIEDFYRMNEAYWNRHPTNQVTEEIYFKELADKFVKVLNFKALPTEDESKELEKNLQKVQSKIDKLIYPLERV